MKRGFLTAVLYLVLAVVMVQDGLFTSKVGVCIDSLYTLKPWDKLDYDLASYNPSTEYQAFFIYPWMEYTLKHLKEGRIPLWTHLAGGGNPFMGNLSCACFYPLNWLGLLTPPDRFWSLVGAIKLWLAAMLTYWLLGRFGLRYFSAFFGGLAFGFSGFMICWLNHPHSNVALFLPAVFLAAEYFIRKRTGLAVAVNAMVLGLQVLGGSPETSFLLFFSWFLYILYRTRQEVELFSGEGMRLISFAFLAGLLGASLVAFQLGPFFEYLVRSAGLEVRLQEWSGFLNGGSGRFFSPFGLFLGLLFPLFLGAAVGLLQRKNTVFVGVWSGLLGGLCFIVALRIGFWLGMKPHLIMQVLPDLYGTHDGGCKNVGDISYSALNGGYTGVLTAFLALYAFFAPCKKKPVPFFIVLLLFSFGAAHSIPWFTHILKPIPLLGFVHNSCLLSLTAFSAAIIAPFALEDLLTRAANIEGKSAAGAGVIGALFVMGCAVLVSGWNFFETGVDLVQADRNTELEAVITAPEHGSIHNGIGTLRIEGRAASEVTDVNTTIDRLVVGRTRTGDAPPTPGIPGKGRFFKRDENTVDLAGYPKDFRFTYSMEDLDEGTYKIVAGKYDREVKTAAGEDWVDIRVVRPKVVTYRNLLILCLSVLGFLVLLARKIPISIRAMAAVAVVVVDLGLFGYGYNRSSDEESIFPQTAVTDFLQKQERPYRFFAEGGILQPNTNFAYGIEHMEWDDRLGLAGYYRFCNFMKLAQLAKPRAFTIVNFDLRSALVDVMNVKYVLVKSDFDLEQEKKFKLAFRNSDVRIYENTQARDRVFISGDWIIWEDEFKDEVLKGDLRKQVVLYDSPHIEKGGSGTAKIEVYENEYVRVSVDTEGQALLVMTDNYFPGWEAEVDGEKKPILLTNGAFRTVPIEKEGRHVVEFRYRPVSFFGGLYFAAGALAICILMALVPRFTASLRRREADIRSYVFPDRREDD